MGDMNRLTKEIEELESKLEMYGTIRARIDIWGTKDEVRDAIKHFKLRPFIAQKSREEEVITADYICKKNKNIIITLRA